MKNSFRIYSAILVCVFVLLSVLSLKSEYAAEKAFYKINSDFTEITKDPKSIPDAVFEKTAHRYAKFAQQFSHSDLAPVARLSEGEVYVVQKEYKTARDIFERVITDFPDDSWVGSTALKLIGQSYAMEENNEALLAVYQRMLKDYPKTELGLRTPLLIIQYYTQKNDEAGIKKAFQEAVIQYNKMIVENPKTQVAFNSQQFIVSCYLMQEEWQKAVNILREIILESEYLPLLDFQSFNRIVGTLNTISVTKLYDFDTPINTFHTFQERNPDHPLNEVFQKMIGSLEDLKAKYLAVKAQEKAK